MKPFTLAWFLDGIKRFFRWPYNVYTLILILGIGEFILGAKLAGILTIVLGAWAFIIELTRPKA